MVSQLKSHPLIEVDAVTIGKPAQAAQLALLEPYQGTEMGDALRAFYTEMNGFSLSWHTRKRVGTASVMGTIQLWAVERVFENRDGQPPYPDQPSGDQAFKPFDFFVPEACAAFLLPTGNKTSNVYFNYFGERPIDTGRSFAEYLECLLQSRGFWYWIQSLSTETAMNPEAERFLQIAPKLFADFDPALFEPW